MTSWILQHLSVGTALSGQEIDVENVKLIQLDFRNVDKNLIAPWETYYKLQPGTLVLIDVSLNCWKFQIANSDSYRKVS